MIELTFEPSGGGHGGVEVGNDDVVGDCLFLLELLGIEVLISAEKLIDFRIYKNCSQV